MDEMAKAGRMGLSLKDAFAAGQRDMLEKVKKLLTSQTFTIDELQTDELPLPEGDLLVCPAGVVQFKLDQLAAGIGEDEK